nr:FAD-binding protein [uncultured Rhodoferax sp.]
MSTIYQQLEALLPDCEVLFPGSVAYKKAIFIGNLLYRFKKPACVVLAKTEADIQTTVRFARANHCKLNVKCGGHSYAGYCLNEDGIVLDISRMQHFHIDHDAMTVTTQAGATWLHLYEGLKGANEQYMIIGGQCPTVGVSGFTLGGGLSTFSRQYGLAVDNLLSLRHVDAEGNLLTLSPHETDPARRDLFWALTGGGGGNFGVSTEYTFRIHRLPNPTVVCGELTWNIPQQTADFKAAMNAFNTMDAPEQLCIDAYWNYDDKTGQFQAMMTTIYNGTMEECVEVMAPILQYKPTNGLQSMHWIDWEREEEGFDQFSNIYHHHVSFVLGEGAITPEVTDIILELMETAPPLIPNPEPGQPPLNKSHILWDHIGGVTKKVPADATAFFWRDGVYVMTAMINWQFPEQAAAAFAWTERCKEKLTPFCLEGQAAYVNYIDSTLQNWQSAYYGGNYPRLRQVKSRWDPTNFFWFKQSIEPVDAVAPAHIWQNWGESVSATPDQLLNPGTIGEVIALVKQAAQQKRHIRVVGAGHSWSPLAPCSEMMLSLTALNRVRISDDKTQVFLEPGVTVDQLAAFLKEHQVCVPSNVGHGVGEATYGGVISTGCHGSGAQMHSISDYAVAFDLITADGSLRHIDTSTPALLNAVRLSLGLFGIISQITLAVQPTFRVHVVEAKVPLQQCLQNIRSFVLDNDYAEISWIPFTDQMYVQKANRSTDPVTRVGTEPYQSAFQQNLNTVSAASALHAITTDPSQTPDVMRAGFELLPLYDYVSDITDYLHNADWRPLLAYKVSDIEVAVEIDDGFDVVRKAMLICQQKVEAWAQAGKYPFNGCLGFRFIQNSAATLSPARGNTCTALIELSSYFQTDLFEVFAADLMQTYMEELPKARVHWAKGFQFMPRAKELIQRSSGAQIAEFLQLRKDAGVDPHNLFANAYLRDLFNLN